VYCKMKPQLKVCVITGCRAEYGLLYWLMKEIESSRDLELMIVATGMHLSPEFGSTYKQIQKDGFSIDYKVEMLLSSDSHVGVAKSSGLAIISFADAFEKLQPDLIVILGDRVESFAAATTAMIANIPIAHIHGGEVTEGAIDDAMRHAISKMSHLHFTATETYRNRVIQLGEQPERVFNVGALGLENIDRMILLDKKEFERSINFRLGNYNLLVTFHPETLEHEVSEHHFHELLRAVDNLSETHIIFTKSNADAGGRKINEMIDEYVATHPSKAISFVSMGQKRYLSALHHVDCVLGNSSSGIIEAPGVKTATVNVGDRQKGRIGASSVIDCAPDRKSIGEALCRVRDLDYVEKLDSTANPYGGGLVSKKIIDIILTYPLAGILKKCFYNVEAKS